MDRIVAAFPYRDIVLIITERGAVYEMLYCRDGITPVTYRRLNDIDLRIV